MNAHHPRDLHRRVCDGPCDCACLTCYAAYTIAAKGTNAAVSLLALALAIENPEDLSACRDIWDLFDEANWRFTNYAEPFPVLPNVPAVMNRASGVALSPGQLLTDLNLANIERLCLGPLRGDGLARRDIASGIYERVHRLQPGEVVLDLGAHIGWFTRHAATAVGPAGLVFAYEPEPRNFACLEAMTSDMPHVLVKNCALSVGDGATLLAMNEEITAGHSRFFAAPNARRIVARTTSLDALTTELPRVDFVKMDIEGAEAEVLEHGVAFLQRHRPRLAIEVDSADNGRRVAAVLATCDYDVTACRLVVDEHPTKAACAYAQGIWFATPKEIQ